LPQGTDHGHSRQGPARRTDHRSAAGAARRGGLRLSAAQLLDLATATHEVTHNVGKAMRRELLRDTSNLRIEDPTGQVGCIRVHGYHPRSSAA
jgi:hypothetical protein